MSPRTTAIRLASFPAAPFYLGFVLAGMATVLLGPILPILSARWHLTDLQAGSLFAAQFAASTLGAVLASHFRRGCVVFGYASVALGLAALALGDYAIVLAAFVLVGAGLGGANTATNLIFGTEEAGGTEGAEGTEPSGQRGVLLTRVNFFWGVGAVSCPQFVAVAVRPETLRLLLLGLSLFALAVFAALTPLLRKKESRQRANPKPGQRLDLPVFLLFSLLLFLYVGGETSIFGWIASYANRFNGLSAARSSLFVSAFWLAIVVGRVAVPALLRIASELIVLVAGLVAAMAGIAVLLFPHPAPIVLACVALTGLGCAPVFPLAVARLLARIGDSRHAGWIFAICGSGAAVLPWLTGLASAHFGSLRMAFLVPLAAMAGTLLLVLAETALPHSHSGERQSTISC
jgi:MFS transporter, FHS family, glucose/mannose:H+ symporter